MFRCTTELKGLIIDADSFEEEIDWHIFDVHYKCFFITSDEQISGRLSNQYGADTVWCVKKYLKLFAPNHVMHGKVLKKMQLKATEIAYLSKNIQFLQNAMEFLGGTIWITDRTINYEEASNAPDVIVKSIDVLQRFLSNGGEGFYGEVLVFPEKNKRGVIVPVKFQVDDMIFPLYMLGRYFGYAHYMNQLHPYSSAIYLNKKEGGRSYGAFNDVFAVIYRNALKRIMENRNVDAICSVPPKPQKENRFAEIVHKICEELDVDDISEQLKCIKEYPPQKNLSQQEREINIKGVFQCTTDLAGKNIVILDDVVSTGATLRECIRELKKAGAANIYIVVLAINQIKGVYWSSNEAGVKCPLCSSRMRLLINSRQKSFFYSCAHCNATIDFAAGRLVLCHVVNAEFMANEDESENRQN